jgi:hypothetical protein
MTHNYLCSARNVAVTVGADAPSSPEHHRFLNMEALEENKKGKPARYILTDSPFGGWELLFLF